MQAVLVHSSGQLWTGGRLGSALVGPQPGSVPVPGALRDSRSTPISSKYLNNNNNNSKQTR
jgi:hypothetical protein